MISLIFRLIGLYLFLALAIALASPEPETVTPPPAPVVAAAPQPAPASTKQHAICDLPYETRTPTVYVLMSKEQRDRFNALPVKSQRPAINDIAWNAGCDFDTSAEAIEALQTTPARF